MLHVYAAHADETLSLNVLVCVNLPPDIGSRGAAAAPHSRFSVHAPTSFPDGVHTYPLFDVKTLWHFSSSLIPICLTVGTHVADFGPSREEEEWKCK